MTVPPGGWILKQTLADGTSKTFKSMGLVWELAEQVADFRAGNGLPRATAKEVVHEIEEQTCARIHNDPAYCTQKKTHLVRAAHAPRSSAAKLADGARILVEWLGTGAETVNLSLAQTRGNVCLTCDRNKLGNRWLKLTSDLVRAIGDQMRAKDERNLRVIDEEKLGVCSACDCVIPLKIWLKRDILAERTSQEVLNDLPEWCWLKNELQPTSHL
jgi:hypothetical protein